MLKNNFYTIDNMTINGNGLRASILLNPDHPLYAGHFPGHPVVPGVCLMQMLKELAEEAMEQTLFLPEARMMKFLFPVDPRKDPVLNIELAWTVTADGSFDTRASVRTASALSFSFSGSFRPSH